LNPLLSSYDAYIPTPLSDEKRGGHIALAFDDMIDGEKNSPMAVQINEAFKAQGVVTDFRSPNIVRIAPAVYTTYMDLYQTVNEILKPTLESGKYTNFGKNRGTVA
ncbi:MAG: hypothetical protein ABIO02_02325, partial [Patescibacteria group bacterium]